MKGWKVDSCRGKVRDQKWKIKKMEGKTDMSCYSLVEKKKRHAGKNSSDKWSGESRKEPTRRSARGSLAWSSAVVSAALWKQSSNTTRTTSLSKHRRLQWKKAQEAWQTLVIMWTRTRAFCYWDLKWSNVSSLLLCRLTLKRKQGRQSVFNSTICFIYLFIWPCGFRSLLRRLCFPTGFGNIGWVQPSSHCESQ